MSFAQTPDYSAIRRRARHVLGDWQTPELVDDSLLVITELVENVVQHTTGGGELALRHHGDAVRVEVTDTSQDMPRVLGPDPRRVGGRGLLLVAAMTQVWGVEPRADGKLVWADVPVTTSTPART